MKKPLKKYSHIFFLQEVVCQSTGNNQKVLELTITTMMMMMVIRTIVMMTTPWLGLLLPS